MLIDFSKTPPPEALTGDVCVIGTGPAGMTVARELADAGRRVLVIESGNLKRDPRADELRATTSSGIPIKEYSRERILGGASTTWAGLSSPYDPIDFASRPGRPAFGWPLGREALDPYYRRASERYRFAPFDWFGPDGPQHTVRASATLQLNWSGLQEKQYLAAAEAQNFGKENAGIFEREGVDLLYNLTVSALKGDAADGRITQAEARTPDGNRVTIKAHTFVLAGGGIENARLLLNSRDLCAAGLGNEHDNVGRYFMNHPKAYAGFIRLHKPVVELPYFFGFMRSGYAGYAGLRLPEAAQLQEDLLNSYVRFEPVYAWSQSEGVEAFVLLLKRMKFLMRTFRRAKGAKTVALRDYAETGDDSAIQNETVSFRDHVALLPKIVRGLPQIAQYAFYRLADRISPRIRGIRLRNFMEMEPRRENRVTLGPTTDRFGLPVPHVHHETSELDRRSMRVLHARLGAEVARLGFGEFTSGLPGEDSPWTVNQDASHHMGTTRMGLDPQTSVVNADCRLHGVPNVYLAGSSVFPTSGNANPTYTIVALAIRLADHLKQPP